MTPAALDRFVPEPGVPSPGTPAGPAKRPSPHVTVLGDAKITIAAPVFKVFAALTSPEQLAAWWGQGAIVEADVGGRYETTLPVGRVEGTIMAIDGPDTLAFVWPLPSGGVSVTTSIHYALTPRGAQTAVHLAHRAPRAVPGEWSALWQSVLESLKAYVEGTGSQ